MNNNFNKLADESDIQGIKIIDKLFSSFNINYTVLKPANQYSSFDIALDIENVGTILVEIKYRKTFYNNLIFETKKYNKLLEFAKDPDIVDVWYLNVFTDNTFQMFSINQIENIKPHYVNKIMSYKETGNFSDDLVNTFMMLPKTTAYNGTKIKKEVYLLPSRLKLSIEDLVKKYNFIKKEKGLF